MSSSVTPLSFMAVIRGSCMIEEIVIAKRVDDDGGI